MEAAPPATLGAGPSLAFDNPPSSLQTSRDPCDFQSASQLVPAAVSPIQSKQNNNTSIRCSDGKKRPVYTCQVQGCARTFNRPARLERHMRAHTGEKPFLCTDCEKSFAQAYHLKRHMLSHTGERPFKCTETGCNLAFQLAHHLHRHEALHREPKPHACSHEGCNERFAKHSQLLRHECTHTGELPYACEEVDCKKRFAYPSLLKTHIDSVHKNVAKYMCEVDGCNVVFASKKELTRHTKTIHPGSFSCTVCGKEFKVESSLANHEATHLIDRPDVPCPFPGCSNTYSSTQNLRTHVKAVHEGQRPWKCSEEGCGKEFAYKQQWQLHEQRHKKKRNAGENGEEEEEEKKKKRKTKAMLRDLSREQTVSIPPPAAAQIPGYSY